MSAVRPIRSVDDLIASGLVVDATGLDAVGAKYAIAITPAVAALIDPDDPNDPMALQFVPSLAELVTTPEERDDPIGDLTHSPVEGIVHRYPDRVLLKAVHVCRSIAASASAAKWWGAGLGHWTSDALDTPIDYIATHAENWKSSHWRRSARAVATTT